METDRSGSFANRRNRMTRGARPGVLVGQPEMAISLIYGNLGYKYQWARGAREALPVICYLGPLGASAGLFGLGTLRRATLGVAGGPQFRSGQRILASKRHGVALATRINAFRLNNREDE